jgi:hypothetical protein
MVNGEWSMLESPKCKVQRAKSKEQSSKIRVGIAEVQISKSKVQRSEFESPVAME